MENGVDISSRHGFWSGLVRVWFTLTRRKIRLLRAGEIPSEGPALFAVSHPAGYLHSLVLSLAIQRPVRCLLPKNLARGPLAGFLARHMGVILYEEELTSSQPGVQEALNVLVSGGTLLVFADQHAAGESVVGTVAGTAAALIEHAEAQRMDGGIALYPVHLFLPESTPQSREILIYIDSPVERTVGNVPAVPPDDETRGLATALEARFQQNAFQLRPADLEFFLSDIEEALRAGLKEDWGSRPDWKQDAEGFVLSRFTTGWVKQANYLRPSQLVSLRKTLDDYRRLQRQCALRELEVQGGDTPLGSGWQRIPLWFETLLGLPIALYGFLNHAAIVIVLYLAGSFKRNSSRARTTELMIRAGVTLAFYILQIFLVVHRWGRAAAGYYAPSLPLSGWYLWRYAGLIRPQARLLFISLTIPALKRKIQRVRHALLNELDHALTPIEEKTSVTR